MRRAWICMVWNINSLIKNTRFYLSLVFGFVLCWMLTNRTINIANSYQLSIQVFEPFIWCFTSSDSILYTSLAMILLLSSFPSVSASSAYLTFHAHRLSWLLGQILTALVLTFGYCIFTLLFSMLFCLSDSFFANNWSETATMLSFATSSFDTAVTVSRKLIKLTTPYECVLQIFLLMFQYILLLSTIQLTCTIVKSRKLGTNIVISISMLSFLLTPDRFMTWLSLGSDFRFYANLFSAWCTPLQHATYPMHSFGYDWLPPLWVSHVFMGSLSAVLIYIALIRLKKFSYQFTVEGEIGAA